MTRVRPVALALALLVITVIPAAGQPDPPPAGPFRAVHLVSLTPQQVGILQAWIADINATMSKAGHKDVRYQLFKVFGKQTGKYEYMWESSWPSGAVYAKIHEMPEWRAVGERHPGVSELTKDEIYNRYVEVR